MKKRSFIFQLYIAGLLAFIILFSVLNGIIYFGVQCRRQRPKNIEEFRNMEIGQTFANSFFEGMEGWKRDVAKAMLGEEYFFMYETVLTGIKCFPVANTEEYSFDNSWLAERTYGGKRQHEGCDIMPDVNERGLFQVVSVSDGVVEQMGWLDKGGYRVGIRSDAGAYFYYAHLYDYAQELKIGKRVEAGEILGTMGDSGYGNEGTVGQFPVHLHFGIYLNMEGEEKSVNPYWILRYIKNK